MKRIKIPTTRALSFLLAMLMLIGLCLTACEVGGEETTAPDSSNMTSVPDVTTSAPDTTASGSDVAKAPYTVEVVSEGGLKLKDITVLIYSDATLTVMNGYAKTDERLKHIRATLERTEFNHLRAAGFVGAFLGLQGHGRKADGKAVIGNYLHETVVNQGE